MIHPQHAFNKPIFSLALSQQRLGAHLPAVWFYSDGAALGQAMQKDQQRVALVGSRDTSLYVLKKSYALGKLLAYHSVVSVSGYARGVDLWGHRGVLEEKGYTLAVLPYGIHQAEALSSRQSLWARNSFVSLEKLCFISQFHPFQTWHKVNAIRRNRLICALSSAVVIMASEVQPHKQSGSYTTACFALEMRIPIWVFMPNRKGQQSSGNIQLSHVDGVHTFSESDMKRPSFMEKMLSK